MPEKQPKSLVAKLAEALNAVGGVEKKGRNEHYNYSYVKAADVAKAVRHELFTRGVVLTADEKDIQVEKVQTNSGAFMNHLTLRVEYTLRDSDSPETITVTAYGVAMDSGDKAIYKAKTGALKYFLRTLGIIPDEKDDPESDETVDESTDERCYQESEEVRRDPKKGRNRIAEYQARAFDSACHQYGRTADQVAQYLRQMWNVTRVNDLPRAGFPQAIKWAMNQDPVADMAATVAVMKKPVNGQPVQETENAAGD